MDFIAGAESTAGGRLARWLAPSSRVEPSKCELKASAAVPHPKKNIALPLIIKDQFGDHVACPSLKVEVVIQKLDNPNSREARAGAAAAYHLSVPDHPYQITTKDTMRFNSITMMKGYQSFSFEELRLASGVWGEAVSAASTRVSAERLVVRPQPDGQFVLNWTPKVAGLYAFRCTLDDIPIPQELMVEVRENVCSAAWACGGEPARPASPPPRVRAFLLRHSAGLRVRASPSLQAEELGRVPSGQHVAYLEELTNKDGTWVRLNAESVRLYTDGTTPVAWCLSHHAPLDCVLLVDVPMGSPDDHDQEEWVGPVSAPPLPPAPQLPQHLADDDIEAGPSSDFLENDECKFPFSIEYDLSDEDERRSPPLGLSPEPSKRDRFRRYDQSCGEAGRSNGNDWWQPVRHRPDNGLDGEDIPEPDVVMAPIPRSSMASRQSQHGNPPGGRKRDSPWHYRPINMEETKLRRPHFLNKSPEPLEAGEGEAGSSREPPPVPRGHKPALPLRDHCLDSHSPHKNEFDLQPKDRRRDHSEPPGELNPEPREAKLKRDLEAPYRDAKPQKLEMPDDGRSGDKLEEVQRLGRRVDDGQPVIGAGGVEDCPVAPEVARAAGTVAAGTQTSPDDHSDAQQSYLNMNKELPIPLCQPKARIALRSSKRTHSSPPPLPARTAPAPPPPRKHALSPAQAECLRGIFAALLWHEGVVHDAIACAAFLKFHPLLPKQGARVVTRPPHDVTPARAQRHSVEVSIAGHYLRLHPSTIETLTRSGMEASGVRARKMGIGDPINEEDTQANNEPGTSSSPSVVNVLPPALRALVALWDALYDSDQLSAATDKYKKPIPERQDVDEPRVYTDTNLLKEVGAKKVDWKAKLVSYKAPYSVRCELCGGASVAPPLAAHMRHLHPGCRARSHRGYDRAGLYQRAEPPSAPAPTDLPPSTCGQLAQDMSPASSLWYVYCERCRDKAIKAASAKQMRGKASLNSNDDVETSSVDHHTMTENAVFLLDLAPLTNSESVSRSPWCEGWRCPPSPPGSVWQPAPAFQCLPALGAAPAPAHPSTARYHSLGRPPPVPPLNLDGEHYIEVLQSSSTKISQYSEGAGPYPRVHRSVSMGQAGGSDLVHAARPPNTQTLPEDQQDTLSGVGSSLLAQPSAELQRLVGCGDTSSTGVSAFEPPRVDPDTLIKSPVLSFVLAKRDLPAYRQKMDASVRINTVRQYAFEALNWLLRSTTQPTCVHDVMWWFCTALDKYARLVPPPNPPEDNKENASNDMSRVVPPTASTAAICPGGRAARGARAAFHAFLGSVSALAPSLSPASAASLQAVRCWALHYSQEDRAFLHRSQVFNVISKILSHSEDVGYDDDGSTLHESLQSYLTREHYVWACPDVTGWCDLSVSSRAGMAGSLVDGSTETFWESGEEDRNKAKWIQIAFHGGSVEDRPHIVCVHVDNTRDTVNKTLLVSFLYSGASGEMYHMQDMEVDSKSAAWLCYTLPTWWGGGSGGGGAVRVRCELRGPEPAVRVRQLRVLAPPAPLAVAAPPAPALLHRMAAADTLRVFRLLTTEVFGKLLEWERSGSESGEGPADDAPADDSDLREHVVGILFAGHQLTSLQREVMSHIVSAIGAEAARLIDDWETGVICADADRSDHSFRPALHQQDNYCFEMLSLLQALSGSQVGRSLLAQQTDLLADLLALLHTGSERVQRQVISLLRRIIAEIPPQKMLAIINTGNEIGDRITLIQHLLCYLGKAITVQVKVKGSGGSGLGSVTMGPSVAAGPHSAWFMRGDTTKKHAQLVAKLLTDMAEEKISLQWALETRTVLANSASQVAQISEGDRQPDRCIALPSVWMALASLCVCEQAHIDLVNGAEGRESRARDSTEPRPLCANHDDGATAAVIECRHCGALCAECDRFLHLRRATRAHHRQICKEEESAIRIDIHEGCGRAKLFWLLLLVDRRTLKGLAEFRGGHPLGEGAEPPDGAAAPGLAGVCRFCGARGNSGLLAIGNVCADHQCQEHGVTACTRVLTCGHLCGGVRGERACLPCLAGCAGERSLRQDADDMCMICFTDPLQAAPAIQLGCGHVFHLHCCKKVLASRCIGPRITFSFAQCPICKEDISHWTLSEALAPIGRLREEVRRKALMRLEYEGVMPPPHLDAARYAMDRYAYYVCHKCEKAYFGGLARCEAESNGSWEPSELVCGACSDVASAKTCPKHGADFLEYKCRYCCSVAVFFCFGTSHFCNACHDEFQRVTNIPRHMLPQCPAGPKGEQLPGSSEECPLHVSHPPTGEEFALGCGVCRHAHVF